MARSEELIKTYCFRRRVEGGLIDELTEEEKLALATCPDGARALDDALTHTHEWKTCQGCRVDVFIEDALSQRTVIISGEITCQ